jgi:hypothetical protein
LGESQNERNWSGRERGKDGRVEGKGKEEDTKRKMQSRENKERRDVCIKDIEIRPDTHLTELGPTPLVR